jgi:hypothetical protein
MNNIANNPLKSPISMNNIANNPLKSPISKEEKPSL